MLPTSIMLPEAVGIFGIDRSWASAAVKIGATPSKTGSHVRLRVTPLRASCLSASTAICTDAIQIAVATTTIHANRTTPPDKEVVTVMR